MTNYEAVIIFNPKLEEEAFEAAITKVEDVIKNGNGEINKTDRWGKRRLAYEIKDCLEGQYVLVDFLAPSETSKELDRILRISEDAIRHLIVKKN